jgi:hypothetical protein
MGEILKQVQDDGSGKFQISFVRNLDSGLVADSDVPISGSSIGDRNGGNC